MRLNEPPPPPQGDIMERIITEVGEMGRYQRWLFVSMMPFGLFFIFAYTVQMFIAATPQEHWCKVPELQHLDLDLRRNLSIPGAVDGPDWNRCEVYDANWTQVLQTMMPPVGSPTVPCRHGWEFLYNDIPYTTVVSERGWVCENAGIAPFAQTMFFVGSLVGCAFFGWVGDKYGRVPALIGANLIGCFGGVLTLFTSGVWDFTIARFIVGLCIDSCAIMIYIIVIEYVGSRHRTWISNISIAVYCGGGALLMVGLALWLLDWRHLVLATSLPMLFVLVTPLYLPESARWLASKGKVNKAVNMLKKFEKVNRRGIPDDLMAEFIVVASQKSTVDESLRAVVASKPLRNSLLVLIAVTMVGNLGIDAILRMSESIGTNFFLTFTLSSASEIPALVLVTLVLDKWGRRSLISGTMAVAGILALFTAFTSKGVTQMVLAVAMRFAVNMAIGAQLQMVAELIPTGARASGNALVHLTVYVAAMFSPYVVYSQRLWMPLPLLIIGLLCLGAGALSLLLPETKGQPMPQTIADAEKLIRDGMLWQKKKPDLDQNERLNEEFRKMSMSVTSLHRM
ncbi:organic cation transporter protein-like isoform X3 [Ostrinia furnacalis]|nr:organic cation transporter protein-like isoform X3 [Ostrinia furnacalis]